MDLVSLFLHQEAVEELLYDVCAGGDSSKPSGLAQRADDGLVLVLQIFYRVFHCGDQRSFCEICGRLGLSPL